MTLERYVCWCCNREFLRSPIQPNMLARGQRPKCERCRRHCNPNRLQSGEACRIVGVRA